MTQVSKKEFWQTLTPKKIKQKVTGGATIAYISGAMTAIAAFMYSRMMLIDAGFVLLMGLGIQFGRSRICATILTIYFIASKIMQIMGGITNGVNAVTIVFVVGFITSIVGTFQFQSIWKEYKLNGKLPEESGLIQDQNQLPLR